MYCDLQEILLDPTQCSFLKIIVNAFFARRVLFTRSLRMATSTRPPVLLPIVLNHVVHLALLKLHYFGFAFQLVSPPDIYSLRNMYCLLHFLLLCDTFLMTPNHNKAAVHNCGSFLVQKRRAQARQNKNTASAIYCFSLFSLVLYGI